jgi:hypothetical protein
MNTWEGGFSRLSLSNSGLLVGTASASADQQLFSAVLPGSSGEAPDAVRLGVPAHAGDEADAADGYTISADGESIVWTEGTDVVVHDVASGEQRTFTFPVLEHKPVRSLDVRTSSNSGIEAAISFGYPAGTEASEPVVVATSPDGSVTGTPVAGRVVTFGPSRERARALGPGSCRLVSERTDPSVPSR